MSLLDESMEKCHYIDKTTEPDGYGGVTVVWREGAEFKAAIVPMSSTEIISAAQQGLKSTFNILTGKNITLLYGEIIQRASDGKYFRITEDGTDNKTPASAGLQIRKVSAEEIDSLPA